jgi:hypothetical protein
MDFDQWAYDTESEIDSATYQIGSAPGASNILAPKLILPGTTKVHLSGFKLPKNYYTTFLYTNGIGLVSKAVRASEPNLADAFVSDASPGSSYVLSHLDVKTGGSGSNEIAYISIDVTKLGAHVTDAELTLEGMAKGTAVPVGIYATNNPQWSEAGLDWKNAPTISGGAVDEQSVSANKSYTWNIGSLVAAAKAAGLKTVTIGLKCDAPSSTGATFGSRRSRTEPPLVQVTSND